MIALKSFIVNLASFITAFGVLVVFSKKYFDKIVNRITEPIINKINEMDRNQCMNYLTEFIADVKHGVEKSEYQKARAHEVYEHYTNELKGNSYIHDQWEAYVRERK